MRTQIFLLIDFILENRKKTLLLTEKYHCSYKGVTDKKNQGEISGQNQQSSSYTTTIMH